MFGTPSAALQHTELTRMSGIESRPRTAACARAFEQGADVTAGASYMTADQIRAAQPAQQPANHSSALLQARSRMAATGQWTGSQFMGRRWPIGCVALEITQRCNLDCTACYLSENSESVKDLPLDEVRALRDEIDLAVRDLAQTV